MSQTNNTLSITRSDVINLSTEIADFIAPRLKIFESMEQYAPENMSDEQWHQILKKMIYSFDMLGSNHDFTTFTKDEWAAIHEGVDLFAKNITHLWL